MRKPQYDEKVFEYIKVYFRIHGYAPSYREIGQELNISASTVHMSIRRLLANGLLETDLKINGNLPHRAFRVSGAVVRIKEPGLNYARRTAAWK